MSITGDIYNIDQSLTGDGITDLELNSLLVDGTFQKVDASYFNNISSNIQTQLNTLSTSITNNANLNYAFKNTNNDFTGSLNKFISIECSNNVKTLTFNGYQASFLEGATSNLQQQINSLTSGSPINGQSATISVGTTTTLSAGSNASVTNSGTNLDAVFNFGIPRGIQGIQGNDGITPTFAINPIVDNLISGSTPYVTITQNPTNNYILKFGLVKGTNGNDGITPTLQIGSVTTGSTANVTIDNTILTNPKLNFTLVNGTNGTNGITPTFSLNPIIDNLVSGSTPYVTITQNPVDVNNYILKFGLVQGAKGDKGDKGDTGDSMSATDILGIITTALGGISIAVLYGYVTTLQAQVTGLITSVGTLQTQVTLLNVNTTGLTYDFVNNSSGFRQSLRITNLAEGSIVVLSPFVASTFYKGLKVPTNPAIEGIPNAVDLNYNNPSKFNLGIITTELKIYNNATSSGTIQAYIDNTGALNVVNLTATGDIISIGQSTSTQTYLQGQNIQIGASSIVEGLFTPTIVIGKKNISSISLHGEVNIATDETNPLSNINLGNGTNPFNIKSDIIQTGTTTATFKDTIVKSLSVTDGNISQSSGTSTLYNLDVIGTSINIGDNNENNTINIGNSQSAVTIEGDSISIGVASVANVINIGNSFTTLTLRSNANEAINIENIMDQMDMDINQILNEINGF